MTVLAAVPLLFFVVDPPLLPAPGVAGAGTTTSLPALSAPVVEVW